MGRFAAFVGIWSAGYMLGFIGFLGLPALAKLAYTLLPFLMNIDSQLLGAAFAGFASSFVTVLAVSVWAFASKPRPF